jgi:hypothetical protein
MSKIVVSRVATGAGHLGVSVSSLALMLSHHASMEFVLVICGTSVLHTIAAAVMTIVEVRTSRTVESRRITALTRIARKHPNKDKAIRLLLAEPIITNSKQLSSSESCRLLMEEWEGA